MPSSDKYKEAGLKEAIIHVPSTSVAGDKRRRRYWGSCLDLETYGIPEAVAGEEERVATSVLTMTFLVTRPELRAYD